MNHHFQSQSASVVVSNLISGLIAFSIVSVVFLSGCAPTAVEAPEAFTKYNSKDGTFAIEYPEGWDADGMGSRSGGNAWATFKKGSLSVRLDASFADSVKADAFRNGGGIGIGMGAMSDDEHFVPEADTAEAIMQAYWKSHYVEKFTDYEQEPGEAVRVQLGPAFMNKFSAKDGFAKIRGIRANIVAADRNVTFLAQCPEKKWEVFGPIFEQMLRGLVRGVEQ